MCSKNLSLPDKTGMEAEESMSPVSLVPDIPAETVAFVPVLPAPVHVPAQVVALLDVIANILQTVFCVEAAKIEKHV